MGKPGSLAAQKRVGGFGSTAAPPLTTEKPYLAGELSQKVSHMLDLVVGALHIHKGTHPTLTPPQCPCRFCLVVQSTKWQPQSAAGSHRKQSSFSTWQATPAQ